MLTSEQNERLTQVGPGTPMGELMRRYWHPIAGSAQLNDDNPTKEVRLLGEDLVLFRSAVGKLGLIEPSCAHRKANLSYGIPEPEGIRCAYHGWLYDVNGQCVDQPSEPEGSRFKEKVKLKAYKVQELGGLIFAYMGPEPAPLLPRYDVLAWDGFRDSHSTILPCNWLQCMENSLDSTHSEYLHGHQGNYVYSMKGAPSDALRTVPHNLRLGFDIFEYGIIKRRIMEGETEESADWKVGHPVLFPNILSSPNQFRVPIDDGHTLHVDYTSTPLPDDVPAPDDIAVYHPPLYGEDGRIIRDYTFAQDYMAWVTQGQRSDGVAQRNLEKLAESDKGIILYRRLLKEQMQLVADGGEPLNVFRDPAKNVRIELPDERKGMAQGLTSIRKTRNVQRYPAGEMPPWINPAPWAGNGYRDYLKQRAAAAT